VPWVPCRSLEGLADREAVCSIGSRGDSYGNALFTVTLVVLRDQQNGDTGSDRNPSVGTDLGRLY